MSIPIFATQPSYQARLPRSGFDRHSGRQPELDQFAIAFTGSLAGSVPRAAASVLHVRVDFDSVSGINHGEPASRVVSQSLPYTDLKSYLERKSGFHLSFDICHWPTTVRERVSTADAIAVIGVPVVDDERRAERRGAHGRVTTVERRNGAMNDFGFDTSVGQQQHTTNPPHIAAPD
jgi:hypothetical protein